jgi:hypothetical protein
MVGVGIGGDVERKNMLLSTTHIVYNGLDIDIIIVYTIYDYSIHNQ